MKDGDLPPWACPKRPKTDEGHFLPCAAVEVYTSEYPQDPPQFYRCYYCGREWSAEDRRSA